MPDETPKSKDLTVLLRISDLVYCRLFFVKLCVTFV
jgi:hypothetical protein